MVCASQPVGAGRREVVEKLSAQVLAPVSVPVFHEVVAAQTSQEAADPRTTQEATDPRMIQEAVATQKPQETATPGRPLEAQRCNDSMRLSPIPII